MSTYGRWQPPITGQNRDVLECAVEDTRMQADMEAAFLYGAAAR